MSGRMRSTGIRGRRRGKGRPAGRGTLGTLALTLLAALAAPVACDGHAMTPEEAAVLTDGGSATKGAAAISAYGCGTCHMVSGVPGATAVVGPPLAGIGQRSYVGGVLPNTPENLVRWIQHPREVSPRTAMPDLGVSERDARDIAAYLYTLK